jgi:hypothetical protein
MLEVLKKTRETPLRLRSAFKPGHQFLDDPGLRVLLLRSGLRHIGLAGPYELCVRDIHVPRCFFSGVHILP